MKIKQKHIGEILQKIYDSEIHLRIGWMWDGGIDFLEGSKTMSIWEGLEDCLMRHASDGDMCKAIEVISNHLCVVYPKSEFTEWYINKFNSPSRKRNARKTRCKYCGVGTGSKHKADCVENIDRFTTVSPLTPNQ